MNLGERLLGLAARGGRRGVIINYHTLTAAEVSRQVDFLQTHFDLIHHDELLPRMHQGGKRPFCLMTFDDGKKSNATHVAPELYRRGVSAVFFVTTDFLSHGTRALWFDRDRVLCATGRAPSGLTRNVVN